MTARSFIASLLLLLAAGCHKHDAQPASADQTVPSIAGSSNNSAATINAKQTDIGPLLAELTQAVRRYGLEQREVPKSLQDLVAKGYLPSVPEAPSGKRFAINKNLEVYLAD